MHATAAVPPQDLDPFATLQPKPRLPAHFTRKSPLGAAGLIGFMLLMFVLPSALNYHLWFVADGPLWLTALLSLPLFLLAGQGVHLMGWVAHDGFHFTFHDNKHVSAAVALVFSSMTLVFFETGMAIDHWSHHRFANTAQDPDLRLLGHHRSFWRRLFAQRNRANWHYFKRALGLALGRPLPADIAHVRLPFSLRTFRILACANLLLALGWLMVYLWIETLLPGSIWVCVLLPLVIGGWLSGLRSFTEHAHTGVGDLRNTRSRTHWLFTLLDYGGNHHLEHHLYPSVPQWRLPALHRWLLAQGFYRQLPDPSVIDPGLGVYRYTLGRYAYGSTAGNATQPAPDAASCDLPAPLAATPVRPVLEERPLRGLEVVLSQVGDSMGPDLIVAELQGPLTLALLQEACWRVQQRHPALRAAIHWPQGRSARPWLRVFAPDRALLDVVVLTEPDATDAVPTWRSSHSAFWQWAAEQQSAHRFDLAAGFLLRVVWVPKHHADGGHLMVCSHHAVVDGTSLMRLLRQTVQELAALQAQLDAGASSVADAAARLPAVQPLPLTAAIHTHLHFNWLQRLLVPIGRWLAVHEQRQFSRRPWLPVVGAIPADAAPAPAIRTHCVFAEGDAARWQALAPLCKQHGVTVGGVFAAAVQLATARVLRERGLPLPGSSSTVSMPLSMDYNMRGRLDHGSIAADAIGLGTSIASVGVGVAPDIPFWALARRIMQSARRQQRLGLPKLFQGVTDSLFNYAGFWAKHRVDHRRSGGAGDGINISNVGRYPFDSRHGPFHIERIFGFNGACVGGPMFIFWLRQINGRLCYNAIACSPAADRAMLEQVFGHVLLLMETLLPSPAGATLTLAGFAEPGASAAPARAAGSPAQNALPQWGSA